MKLIFAQGNPTSEYEKSRHNIGFMILDFLAEKEAVQFQQKSKFQAEVAEFLHHEQKIILAKPTTFYNLSGRSFRALVDFYKLTPEDILIIHDDMALPIGSLRTRIGGSGGGNNGIKSINAHGGESTMRLRIGIGVEGERLVSDSDFVLGKLSKKELEIIKSKMPQIVQIISDFAAGSFATTTHK